MPADLGVDGQRRAVGTDESAVVLLLAVERVAPLPIEHGVGAVADGLPGHGAGFAGIERGIHRRPVHRAGLGFHHPEILALPAARKVVHGGIARNIQVPFADVVVPGGEVEIAA